MKTTTFGGLGIMLVLAGCGARGGANNRDPGPSCTVSVSGAPVSCYEYSGSSLQGALQSSCTAGSGTYSALGCDQSTSVGGCAVATSVVTTTTWFYPPMYTSSSVQMACSLQSAVGTATYRMGGATGTTTTADAGTTVTPHDSGTTVSHPDSGDFTPVTHDSGTTTNPGMYGTCGRPVFNCLCNATGQAAQQMCIQNSSGCVNCIVAAQEAACPSQSAAFNACSDEAINPSDGGAGCQDQACLDAACTSEETAYNTCLRNHGTDATYGAAIDACTGDLTTCPQ